MSLRRKRGVFPAIYRVSLKKWKSRPALCHQVGEIWSYRAVIFFPCSKSRDLGPGHGFRACSFKNKGTKLDFHILGVKKTKKKLTKSVKCWSPELQMIPKRCGRLARIFSQGLGLKTPTKSDKNLNVLRDFLRFSGGLSQKPVNSRTNGWEAYVLSRHMVRRWFMWSAACASLPSLALIFVIGCLYDLRWVSLVRFL